MVLFFHNNYTIKKKDILEPAIACLHMETIYCLSLQKRLKVSF
jgi:hypothetical protein